MLSEERYKAKENHWVKTVTNTLQKCYLIFFFKFMAAKPLPRNMSGT
jgi:hypothetical protein